MNKFRLKYGILLLGLLLCFIPARAHSDSSLSGSFTVASNKIVLAVGDPTYTSLTLTWNSPQLIPGWGPATKYDIRYSLFPIDTVAAWQAATQVGNPPPPGPPGSPETLIVIGLNQCTVYYFAIKAADANDVWTPLSNSPNGKTLCPSDNGGGGGGGLPASFYACPMTLTVYMPGNITTARMSQDGVLCETCLANDAAGEYTLEINEDAQVMLADNTVPMVLRFSESSTTPPTPENTVIMGPVYELNAYSSTLETTPSPITISPPARLILSYNPDELPQNATEVIIANYDSEEGWLALEPVPGAVAEIGKAHCQLNHFSLFAVLANLEEPEPAKFEVSNLTIEPGQVQPNQEITISLNVANTGGTTGDYNLEIKIDGVVKTTRQITLDPRTSSSESFKLNLTDPGKHYLEIGSLTGQIDILSPTTPNDKWRPLAIAALIILVLLAIIVLALIIMPLISPQNR